MDTSSFGEFIKSYFLWRDPMIVGAVSGAICGFLGVYVVLRRIVFVGAMLSQVSSFGVALAFYLQGFSALSLFGSLIDPFALSLIITGLAVLFFALKSNFFRISQGRSYRVRIPARFWNGGDYRRLNYTRGS